MDKGQKESFFESCAPQTRRSWIPAFAGMTGKGEGVLERVLSFLFLGFLPYLVFIGCFLPGVFLGGLWAGLGIGAGLLGFGAVWCEQRQRPAVRKDWALFVFLLLIYGFALAPFGVWPDVSFKRMAQISSVLLPLLLLSSPQIWAGRGTRRLFMGAAIALGVATLALSFEFGSHFYLLSFFHGADGKPSDYNRGLSYAMMLFWPILGYLSLTVSRRYVFLFVLSVVPVLFPSLSRATMAAFFVGAGFWAVASLSTLWARRCAFVLVPSLCLWPVFISAFFLRFPEIVAKLPPSWHHRVEIWDYVSYRITAHPWFGWGAGASPHLSVEVPNRALYSFVRDPAAHPHNAILQLWVELGIPGLVFGVVFALLTVRAIRSLAPAYQPFAFASWGYCLVISLCAYNLWADSLMAAFAFVLLFFSLLPAINPRN